MTTGSSPAPARAAGQVAHRVGLPLATLQARNPSTGAVSASTLARATSGTWTKSRVWPPSSKTSGARPAASALRKIEATPA